MTEPITYEHTVDLVRELRRMWRRSDDEYRDDPQALTRLLNDNDGAAARMRTRRAKDRP